MATAGWWALGCALMMAILARVLATDGEWKEDAFTFIVSSGWAGSDLAFPR